MTTPDASWRIEGIQRKLERAASQMNALIEEINAYIESHPARTVAEPDAKGTKLLVKVFLGEEPDIMGWGLQLGSIFYTLRSSLDNLAWHLATKGGGEAPPNPRDIYFPILDQGRVPTKAPQVAAVEPCPAAIIEWAQPYQRRHAPELELEPLWLLNQLGIADKHRVVTPALVAAKGFEPEQIVADADTTEIHVHFPDKPLKDGATVMTITPANVDVKGELTLGVALYLAPIDKLPNVKIFIDDLLHQLAADVDRVVNMFGPFL